MCPTPASVLMTPSSPSVAALQLKFGSWAVRGEYEQFKVDVNGVKAKPYAAVFWASPSPSSDTSRGAPAVSLLRGVLDGLVLIGGVLAGGCVPSYISQYQQRVGGRLDQVKNDLAPFQGIANRFHGGELDALVKHHLASPDKSFQAEGQAVKAMLDNFARLQAMMDGLTGSIWHQMAFLAASLRSCEIGVATWQNFLPSFNLDPASMVVAGAFSGRLLAALHGPVVRALITGRPDGRENSPGRQPLLTFIPPSNRASYASAPARPGTRPPVHPPSCPPDCAPPHRRRDSCRKRAICTASAFVLRQPEQRRVSQAEVRPVGPARAPRRAGPASRSTRPSADHVVHVAAVRRQHLRRTRAA